MKTNGHHSNGGGIGQHESEEKSGISRKFPRTFLKQIFRTSSSWLDSKRIEDEAEGLWRIHDTLYDFTDFVDHHPGGSFWLKETKGTDITEAFEVNHISTMPEKMLSKYRIRDAIEPRNYILTFKDDGFYKVLKSRVRKKLPEIDRTVSRSDLIHTALLLTTFVAAISSVALQSVLGLLITAIPMTFTVIASHNYFHQRDNWRMLLFNLSLMNYKEWRISHCLSHHIYTNSYHDLEITLLQPFFEYFPNAKYKTWFQRFGPPLYAPLIYCFISWFQFLTRIIGSIVHKNILSWDELIGFSLPFAMYCFTSSSLSIVLLYWLALVTSSSFVFALIGLNAAHHAPDILHDGDALRSDKDWGLFQVDAVAEASDTKESEVFSLVTFGNHTMHHLFPTLDSGVLRQLSPILFATMDEFNVKWREFSRMQHFKGNFQQLARIEAKTMPRG